MVRYVIGAKSGNEHFYGDGGPASQATLNFPSGIVLSSVGMAYIADTWNHRIRCVDLNSGIITTIAGTGQAKFSGDHGPASTATLNEPVALALDNLNCLFVADQSNNRIRMIDLNTGIISTIAGNGESGYTGDGVNGTQVGLSGPSGVAVDQEGNIFIADTFNGRIRHVHRKTGVIDTIAGDGGTFQYHPGVNEDSLSLSRPYAIAIDYDGCLFITDTDNHLIRKWDPSQKHMSLVAGNGAPQFSGDGDSPEKCGLNYPFGVAIGLQREIFIADTFNQRIRVIVCGQS